jgi:hypothetical protein
MRIRWIYKPAAERHLVGTEEDVEPLVGKELIRTARAVEVNPADSEPADQPAATDAVLVPDGTPESPAGESQTGGDGASPGRGLDEDGHTEQPNVHQPAEGYVPPQPGEDTDGGEKPRRKGPRSG